MDWKFSLSFAYTPTIDQAMYPNSYSNAGISAGRSVTGSYYPNVTTVAQIEGPSEAGSVGYSFGPNNKYNVSAGSSNLVPGSTTFTNVDPNIYNSIDVSFTQSWSLLSTPYPRTITKTSTETVATSETSIRQQGSAYLDNNKWASFLTNPLPTELYIPSFSQNNPFADPYTFLNDAAISLALSGAGGVNPTSAQAGGSRLGTGGPLTIQSYMQTYGGTYIPARPVDISEEN